MNEVGTCCTILSSGRGRQNGSGAWHRRVVSRKYGLSAVYADFYQFPVLTHFVTAYSLAILLITLLKKHPCAKVLAYNRSYHYLPALFIAKLMRSSVFLDLEDGYINESNGRLRRVKNAITKKLFTFFCPSGVMLAASSLREQIENSNNMVCYGVANESHVPMQDWTAFRLRILFGGTLLEEVGSQILIDALKIAAKKHSSLEDKIEVVVTGKGPWEGHFSEFAMSNPLLMIFAKNLTTYKYSEILKSCHVGLSLRLSKFEMGTTTFPSKVLEYAANGLLVVSTRTSDVPELLGDASIYLERETPEDLAELILLLTDYRQDLQSIALKGRARVFEQCSSVAVGNALSNFFNEKIAKYS